VGLLFVDRCLFSCYAFSMSITQTVEVPVSHRLTIEVPREVPTGPVVLTFTPAAPAKPRMTEEAEIALINLHAEELNAEAEMDKEFLFAGIEAFEEDLKHLTPEMTAILKDTTVPISPADIIFDRDGKERSES